MGTQTNHFEQGEKYFVTTVLGAAAATSLLTIIGAGSYFHVGILALGVGSFLVNLLLGQGLYGGGRWASAVLGPWAGVQLLVALGMVAVLLTQPLDGHKEVGVGAALLIGLVQATFGGLLLTSRNVGRFLAHRRGETVHVPQAPAAVTEDEPVWTKAGTEVVFADPVKRALSSLSVLGEVTTYVLLALAGINLALCGYLMVTSGRGLGLFPIGLFNLLLSLVLWTTSDDLNYLSSTRGSAVPHLTNTATDMSVLSALLLAGGVIAIVVVAIGVVVA